MMVISEDINKPTLKISMSSTDSSSEEESDISDNHAASSEDDKEDAESNTSEISADSKGEDAPDDERYASDHSSSEEEKDNRESDISENEVDSKLSGEDDEADMESVSSNNENTDALATNEGWADSVAKILGSNKPKNKKTLVLSRAKKHSDIVKIKVEEKPSFEVIGESKEKKPVVTKEVPSTEGSSEPPVKKVKLEKPSIRQKPNVLEKDRERLLSKIATKGVVQLFNAVRNQQKTLEKDLDRTDLTEGKKQKILKKFDKRTFLDTLMGKTKSVVVDEEANLFKNEVKPEDDKPKWGALRDDFMMGAKMKDWDKESVEE